jgi:D-alanyl-D-alanine carboxypeptidase (penicillin-binding protein 5/6)
VLGFIIATLTAVMLTPPAFAVERVGGADTGSDSALQAASPAVAMPAGILRTVDGRTLWERDADVERPMASITKVMTALVVLEHAKMDDTVTISPEAAAVGEAGVDLVAGQTLTVQQLLESMLVVSANNAAFALAEHVGGSKAGFVALMNEKARELGLEHTAFTNPHGLDEPGHHTSAADIATLMQVAMANQEFARIVAIRGVDRTIDGRTKFYESSNKLLATYQGTLGGKTGWTDEAGYCVTEAAKRDSIGFVAVVLGADSEDDRFAQARALLDWGFAHYKVTQVASAESTAGLIPVSDFLDTSVAAVVSEDASVPVFDLDGTVATKVDMVPEVDAPVAKGQRLGTLTVMQGDRLLAQVPLVAQRAVRAPDAWQAIGIWFSRIWRTIAGDPVQAKLVPVM